MATNRESKKPVSRDALFVWEGKDKAGRAVRGEMRASGIAGVQSALRRRGVLPIKVKKQRLSGGRKITDKDLSIFTRQLATMLKAGVPMLQSFDIVSRGHSNPAVSRLLSDIRTDVETGSNLATAFRKFPQYFDALFCNLVAAGEQAGILDALLERLAVYKEKSLALKGKIKSAMFYPIAVIVVAFIVTAVIMIFVIPSFKEIFKSFGAELPAPTLIVMNISDVFVKYWYIIFGTLGGGLYFFFQAWKRSLKVQIFMDRLFLKLPLFGGLVEKASIARWTRTLSTMFAAGVPLVEALDSVGGASGNQVYLQATKQIQNEVSSGTALAVAMENAKVFPNMAIQMTSIGEESGALDDMLAKVADFYEREVDDAVDALSSLMEPLIMVVLGTLIGGIVISMYLPIFKLGAVV